MLKFQLNSAFGLNLSFYHFKDAISRQHTSGFSVLVCYYLYTYSVSQQFFTPSPSYPGAQSPSHTTKSVETLVMIARLGLITQINGLTANVSQMKKSSKLVKYLPINNSIMPQEISDLHVIMALAHENNRSREKLHAMDKGIVQNIMVFTVKTVLETMAMRFLN